MTDPTTTPIREGSVNPQLEPLAVEIGKALAAAEKWYEAVGPTEAAAQVEAAHAALLRMLTFGDLDISTALSALESDESRRVHCPLALAEC
jgi:hypothetical protein